MPKCDRNRSILMWLITQERVMGLWIEQAMSTASADEDVIRRLDVHRRWLARQIDAIARRRAAA